MNFLIDNALSPKLARILRENGHDAVHVRDYNLASAPDSAILDRAASETRVIITADGDFATMLALLRLSSPSMIFVREDGPHRAQHVANILLRHLAQLEEGLRGGSLVVIRQNRIRIRPLPILPK